MQILIYEKNILGFDISMNDVPVMLRWVSVFDAPS
jgi:hypothetical protein